MEHFEWYLGFILKAIPMLLLTYYTIRLAVNASNNKFPKFLYDNGKINASFFIYMVPVFLFLTGVFMQLGTYTDNLMRQGEKPEWVKNMMKENDRDEEKSNFEKDTERTVNEIKNISDKFSFF